MADRYWVLGNGTWDASSTTHWSTLSGGAGGASAPTSSDNAFFDTNSSASTIYTVTVAGTSGSPSVSKDLNLSGKTPAFSVSSFNLQIFGSLISDAANIATITGIGIDFRGGGAQTADFSGLDVSGLSRVTVTNPTLKILSDITCETFFVESTGTVDANDFNVTIGGTSQTLFVDGTLLMKSGIFDFTGTGGSFSIGGTIDPGTSTIKIHGTTTISGSTTLYDLEADQNLNLHTTGTLSFNTGTIAAGKTVEYANDAANLT